MKKSIILSVGALFLITGCGTSINLTKYSPIQAPKASHMPSPDELQSKKPNVIVMDLDNNHIKLAEEAEAGKAMATTINGGLASSHEVNIVKRLDNTDLKDEVKLSQKLKSLGDKTANYIVTGKIDNATYNWTFHEESTWTDKKGRVHVIPPSISYKACVSGNVNVYKLPDLKVLDTIPVEACATDSEDARSPSQARKSNPGLVRNAATEAADDATYPLMNFFSPKGYITEVRKNKDGDLIAKLTIGTDDGLKEGDTVKIYTIKDSINPLTNKKESNIVEVAVGKVSNQNGPHFAWIIIDKDDINPGYTIHIGDFAKVEKEESWFSKLKKIVN